MHGGRLDVALPDWAEHDRLARASQFFSDNRLHIGAALALGSLVMCYAIPRGARLLAVSGGFHTPLRRVRDTASFLLEVNAGPEATSVTQVRLVHATVRHHIVRNGQWDDGVPICQEDLLGALMLFSMYVLHALERLGVRPTQREAEDYLHLWRVVGAMLGIPVEVLPANVGDAVRLCELMESRHVGPSAEGAALTRLLIREYQSLLPGPLLRGIIPAVMRHIVPAHVADGLGIAPSRWERALPHVLGLRSRRVEHSLFDWFLRSLNRRCWSDRGTGARRGSVRPRCCSPLSRLRRIPSR